ncbi:hypothetical protein ATANTOWER_024463 [Ataeniobius toweri]|uniref:Uncharacterized protein n=1 Tax=Ataeniobius toweri TaxID=208326 RepID=A0ABU7A9D3_9TELE|nr:hypothetical protein [Ataeniobius toweri]
MIPVCRKPALKTSPGSRTPDQLLIPPHVPSYADLKTVLDVCSEVIIGLWWRQNSISEAALKQKCWRSSTSCFRCHRINTRNTPAPDLHMKIMAFRKVTLGQFGVQG